MRKRPPNKVHTSPERAGEQNMTGIKLPTDENGIMPKIIDLAREGKRNNQAYKGLWTAEALEEEINKFMMYCYENSYKPTPSGLCIWLSISKSQYWEWKNNPTKYGDKSRLIQGACLIMENYLEANIDKYPTGSMFLLRTSHGHVEQSKVDISMNDKPTTADEVAEMISKMGLDKQE